MGGKSEQTTTQSATTSPWLPAQGTLNNILGQVNTQLGNTNPNATENNAFNQLSANAGAGNPFSGQITSLTNNLFSGGGAMDQAGKISQALDAYKSQLTPFASGSMVGNNPALADQLHQIQTDVTGDVNSQFAAAGRDFSGANQQALARGVAAGQAPVIAAQYNQDVANQLGAANSLYNASNSTAGLLSGLQQQKLANQSQGITTAQSALDAQNYGPMQQLAIESQKRGIPMQNLGLLAQIGIPIAGLGSQSTGQSNTENQMSGAQQFSLITGGLKNLFSDRRLKTDIEPIGKTNDGKLTIYRYRYVGHPEFHIGFMADEVEKHSPEAVSEAFGFKTVDYNLATQNAIGAA